jgi:hypothetical protein
MLRVTTAAIATCWLALACGDPPAPSESAHTVTVADVQPKDAEEVVDTSVRVTMPDVADTNDTKSEVADSALEVTDVAPDVAKDVPKDVPLPVPATVPSDLPQGVVAVPLHAGLLDTVGKTPDLKLTLPAGTVSFLAVVRGAHPGFYQLAKIIAPDGTPLAKGKCAAEVCVDCKNRVGPSPSVGSALLPSSSGVQASQGAWYLSSCAFQWGLQGATFAPQPWAGKPSETVAFFKTALDGKLPPQGKLGLRFWCTTAGGLSAQKAMADARIVAMLKEAQALFSTIGVTLQVIDVRDTAFAQTVIDLPEDVTTTGASDMDLLFGEAAEVGGSAVVDVFFVAQLLGGSEGKGVVGGVAGSIPGPAFYHGIPRSGVVLALQSLGKDGTFIGRVLAHELGHFLGLWHPNELNGKILDPLADTPECTPADDADQNGALDVKECQGKGADNVMFWFAGNKTALFTAEQGQIVRGNPLVVH